MTRTIKYNKTSKRFNRNSRKLKNKKSGGGGNGIINHRRFSTGNPTYKNMSSKGIVHITEAVGINVAREIGSGFANFFGSEGFESTLYDEVKTKAFDKLKTMMNDEQLHVGNIKIDIETDKNTIFCHLVGTIYMKKKE
jgi:hypothetical protein